MMKYLLRPSLIKNAGCGVFTTENIKKGEFIDIWDESDCKFVTVGDVEAFNHFGIKADGGWFVPLDFRRISLGWYLNNSATPNLESDKEAVHYYASRDIEAGEELTIDYLKLE